MTTEQQPSDAELISAVRSGDTAAYGELFARHVEAARRLAHQLTSAGEVEDLVSDAFAKVLTIVQRGDGPDLAFRAYLLTALRSLHVDSVRGAARLRPVDDLTPFDDGIPFRDTAVEGFENRAAARAFASLPERWQLVLWHTEVEDQKPADVAKLLGMSANSVSALAYRAREGLRQAFLSMHAQDTEDDACAWTQDNLGAYIRSAASRRDSSKVREHIDDCRRCMGIYLELSEVNTNLSGILGPLVLGSAAAGYIAAALGGASQSGWLGFVGRAGDVVANHGSSAALAGVAATIVLVTGLVLGLRGQQEPAPAAADPPLVPTPAAPLTFGTEGPTLSPDVSPGTPSTRPPTSTTPGDSAKSSAQPTTSAQPATLSAMPGGPSEPDEPQDEPNGTITVPPTTPPPGIGPAPKVNAAVRVAAEKDPHETVKDVTLAVSGLPAGGGTLEIATSNNQAVRLDGDCSGTGPARTCAVPAGTRQLRFMVNSSQVTGITTVAFTISPVGAGELDRSDNTVQVVLEPAP